MKFKELKLKIFKNTSWLILGEGLSRLLIAFLLIYTARILGPTQFGIFNFALAFCSVFLVFSNLGLSDIVTRELARDGEREKDYSAILSLKTFLSIIAFILIFLASFFVDQEIRKIVWILGVYTVANHFLVIFYAFFRARHKMEYEAWTKIFRALILSLGGFILISYIPLVETLSYVFLGSTLLAIFLVLILLSRFVIPISFSLDFRVWKRILRLSWPLGLTMLFTIIYIHIDSVMMGFWGQIVEVGWYNAAYKLIGILIISSSLIGASFFPILSKLSNQKEEFYNVFKFFMKLMIILALPIVIFSLILGPFIINLLYGIEFSPAGLAFQILVLMAGLNFLYIPFYLALIAFNLQKKILIISLIAALTNIILNLILIPKYSLYGAASSTLITYIVLLVLAVYYSKPILFQRK